MSDRLKTLQNDIATARRASNQSRLTILTMLLAKVQRIAKDDGNREVHDDDLIQGVSRYRKEVDEMKAALEKSGRPTDEQDVELSIVTAYLPSQMTDDDLDREIETALAGTARDKKAIGVAMKHLNGGFKGQFDPKRANAMIAAKLS